MNQHRKKLCIMLLIFVFILVGCGKVEDSQPAQTTDVEIPDEKEPEHDTEEMPVEPDTENNTQMEDGGEEETIFEVKDSKYINDWKELIVKEPAFITDDWESYLFRENSPLIGYSLHFPGKWDIQYSVFNNEKGEKVAELFPPIIMSPGQSLLDKWEANSECELISKEDINVGDLTGFRVVMKTYPHGGDIEEWYPHTYYLTDGSRVFAMSFYTLEIDPAAQKNFDKIIETFQFID